MRFFDCHLHLPSPDRHGLGRLLQHIDAEPGMIGGNLVLNTPDEVDFAAAHRTEIPSFLNLVPYFSPDERLPPEVQECGWYKVHPALHRYEIDDVPRLVEQVVSAAVPPQGILVHSFPWGPETRYNTSLPIVIGLARAMPQTWILATHGGGYESWAFRAHAGTLKNVVFDFSVSLSYYSGSDLLRPLQRYLRFSPGRVVFGSDWPHAECSEQLQESVRWAEGVGISAESLEHLLLENARRYWEVEV